MYFKLLIIKYSTLSYHLILQLYIYKKTTQLYKFFNNKETHQLFAAKLQTILQYFNRTVFAINSINTIDSSEPIYSNAADKAFFVPCFCPKRKCPNGQTIYH